MNREVIIAGRIDSDSAAAFAQRLQCLTEADVLTVKIDSPGGDTVAGLAMHDLLKTLPCRTEAVVLGLCASAATFVACGCQSIAMLPSAGTERFTAKAPVSFSLQSTAFPGL